MVVTVTLLRFDVGAGHLTGTIQTSQIADLQFHPPKCFLMQAGIN
jgi:hypothetical protein